MRVEEFDYLEHRLAEARWILMPTGHALHRDGENDGDERRGSEVRHSSALPVSHAGKGTPRQSRAMHKDARGARGT